MKHVIFFGWGVSIIVNVLMIRLKKYMYILCGLQYKPLILSALVSARWRHPEPSRSKTISKFAR